MAFYMADKPNSAADCFKKAVKLRPDYGPYYHWCGAAYYRQLFKSRSVSADTILERAEEYAERAAEMMSDNAAVQMLAGRIQESHGNYVKRSYTMIFPGALERHYGKAYKYYHRAVEINPTNEENVAKLSKFCQDHSGYGFQPYNPAPQPSTEISGQPEADAPNNASNAGAKAYLPANYSVEAGVAFVPLLYNRGWGEIYRNPYKTGGEYVVISGWSDEQGYKAFDAYENAFDYDPETGDFYFTGGYMRTNYLDEYYMKAHVVNETTVEVEWLIGNRMNGPENAKRDSQETLTLQYVADKSGYAFANAKGSSSIDIAAPISAMYAFLDFIEAGGEIGDPPPKKTLPHFSGLKHPELYTEPGTAVVAGN